MNNLLNERAAGFIKITGEAAATVKQMQAYILAVNPSVLYPVIDMIPFYISEGKAEGIWGDVAFAQSCLESRNFAFSGSAEFVEWLGVQENPQGKTYTLEELEKCSKQEMLLILLSRQDQMERMNGNLENLGKDFLGDKSIVFYHMGQLRRLLGNGLNVCAKLDIVCVAESKINSVKNLNLRNLKNTYILFQN